MLMSIRQGGNTNCFVISLVFFLWLGFTMECKFNMLLIHDIKDNALGSRGSGIINHCLYSILTRTLNLRPVVPTAYINNRSNGKAMLGDCFVM